jgi:hypothetical protein
VQICSEPLSVGDQAPSFTLRRVPSNRDVAPRHFLRCRTGSVQTRGGERDSASRGGAVVAGGPALASPGALAEAHRAHGETLRPEDPRCVYSMTYCSIRVVMAARPADVQVVVGLLGSGCKVRLSSCRNRRNPRRVCAFVKRSLGEKI